MRQVMRGAFVDGITTSKTAELYTMFFAIALYDAGYSKKKDTKCVYEYDGEVMEYCVKSPCPNYTSAADIEKRVASEILKELYFGWSKSSNRERVYRFFDEIAERYGIEVNK